MDKHFLGTITCVASDRLITDENGEQFYECMTQEELNAIQVNTDKNAIKSNLFYALGRMDAILSAVVGQITKNRYVEIIFAIKDGGKSIALNISNDKLNGNEVIALGLIEIGVGIGIAILAPSSVVGVAAGLIISSFVSYFLADLYLYLKDKAPYLWKQIKTNFDETNKTIALLVEKNIDSLRHFKSNLIDKISSWIDEFNVELQYNSAHPYVNPQRNLESSDYKSLIELLLDSKSNALDIDSLLHTFPNYLAYLTHTTTDTTNSLSLSNATDSIPMCIKAQCLNHKNEPLANREIYVYSPNFASFVDKAKSDDKGYITFNNACVSSKMTNSDLYFVLNRYGLDEEQKDYHIKISPSKTIQPNDKRARELTDQTLTFNKHIPKAIKANDSIMPNIKVNAIEFIEQNINNSTHIHLKAHYVLRDSQKKYIQGDEHTYTIHSIQKYKHKTKWGYIVFDKDEDIESTLREMTASKPLIKSVRFKELEGITGEIVSIPFKEQWEDKQVRFFAYIYKPHKDIGVDVEFEESIPPNVIRIEAQDNSGEYIEIVLPEETEANSEGDSIRLAYNEHTLQDSTIRSDVDNNTLAMAARILLRNSPKTKKPNTPNKSTSMKPKSLSRQEVLDIVDKLPMGLKSNGEANPRIRLVKSQKELDELWERLTKNTKELQNGTDTRHGKPIYQRMLDDGTRINYRVDSKTGGSTIDINSRNPKTNIRIHIDK